MRFVTLTPNPFSDTRRISNDFNGLAELYHENSKLVQTYPLELIPGSPVSPEDNGQPNLEQLQLMQRAFKVYETAPQVKLPAITSLPPLTAGLQETVFERRTGRNFAPIDPGLAEIARLLNFCYGITYTTMNMKTRNIQTFRAVPSGGALYPLELYLVPLRPLSELGQGLYHFNVKNNTLEQLSPHDQAPALQELTMSHQPANLQHILGEGSLAIVFTAMFSRTIGKYGQRGYRYLMFEAGHAMQNLLLAAGASGYKAFESAAFDDDRLSDLLGIHGVEEAPLYYAVIGG